jgi:hypothetical protein
MAWEFDDEDLKWRMSNEKLLKNEELIKYVIFYMFFYLIVKLLLINNFFRKLRK